MIKRIDRDLCNGCAICLDSCAVDVLRLDKEGKAYAAYPKDCVSCLLCAVECPTDAIEVSSEIPLPLPLSEMTDPNWQPARR
ncbi:MAG: ferredoxin family protein [Dehalococcoidia bacterium]|nr:ferredoxin family protein [Dehalococcoidia bacterium]